MIVLWVLAAAAALWGLVGLWRIATTEAKAFAAAPKPTPEDGDEISMGQFDVLAKLLGRNIQTRPAAARRDFLLLGGAIVLGFAADLLSLTL